MHTTTLRSGKYEARFIHNGDYSGDTTIVFADPDRLPSERRFQIPTDLLVQFVAEMVRNAQISRIESMRVDDLLGL